MIHISSFNAIHLIIEVFSGFLAYMCTKIPIAPESVRKKLNGVIGLAQFAVMVLSAVSFDANEAFSLFQTTWKYICIFSLILAVSAPVAAWNERANDPTAAKKDYVVGNLGFNLLGFLCVWCMLSSLSHKVPDFRFLQSIPVFMIISLTAPLCLWVVLSYQSREQQEQENNNLNHDASLGRINQILNILHLFNAFFCSLTATALMFAYTLYCRLYHVEIVLDVWYLLALSFLLVFFYTCGVHPLPHVRMVCMSNVPAILIVSVYWMSWFTASSGVFFCQLAFIVIHSLIYVTIVCRYMIFYKKDEAEEQLSIRRRLSAAMKQFGGTLEKIGQKMKENRFYMITLVAMTAIYVVFILVPHFIMQQSVFPFNLSEKISWYLLVLSIPLMFFYVVCVLQTRPYVRIVCMGSILAILIASVCGMSWFKVSLRVVFYQSAFIVIHSLIYVAIIYRNMGFYKKGETNEQPGIWGRTSRAIKHPKETYKKIKEKLEEYQFYIITIVIMIAIYAVFIFVPHYIMQQSVLSFSLSEKIIAEVCKETNCDVDAIFEEMKENEWANQETETIDRVQFADFVYRTFRPEILIQKNIIAPDEQSLSYDKLKVWYDESH